MPIYQWKCKHCELVVEELRKVDDFEPPKHQSDDHQCEFIKQVTAANFRIDPAAG